MKTALIVGVMAVIFCVIVLVALCWQMWGEYRRDEGGIDLLDDDEWFDGDGYWKDEEGMEAESDVGKKEGADSK